MLARWRERDVFRLSLHAREQAPPWIFYEGPPTANGPPGAHHVLSRVFKDIYPRYKTMRGHLVERKGAGTAMGCPSRSPSNRSSGSPRRPKSRTTRRSGSSASTRNAANRCSRTSRIGTASPSASASGSTSTTPTARSTRPTSSPCGGRSRSCTRRTSSTRVTRSCPYCYRCGTALSSHEVALGYQDVVDPSVYVRLRVLEPSPPLQPGDSLLVWTTTPWTLPGNVALAVGAEVEYVRARAADETLILAACARRAGARRRRRGARALPRQRSSWASATRRRSSRSATARAGHRRCSREIS